MKKLFTLTIVSAVCSVNFLFAGFDIPATQNCGLVFKDNVFSAQQLSLNLPEQNLFTKKGQQKNAFGEGTIVISAGYGFGNFSQAYFKAFQTYAGYSYKGFGPIHGKFEYGLSDNIGLGVSVNYISAKVNWTRTYYNSTTGNYDPYIEGWDWSSLSILARMNIHFATNTKLDPYWGVGAGYRQGSSTYYTGYTGIGAIYETLPTFIPFGFETTVGLRFYFSYNVGIYFETGFAKAIIQGGLAIKL